MARCPRCSATSEDVSLFTNLFRRTRTGVLAGRYRIVDTLHTGRVTTVYRAAAADDPGRQYAIKELSPLTLIRADERREAESSLARAVERWARIEHPNLARLVDHFEDQEHQYVVFEYVPGWSGERIIAEPHLRTGSELARNWGAQLCDLLEHLHGLPEPLYLPFLAPAHIVVSPDGWVRVVGLGLGRFYNPGAYGPHGSIPGYAAPELAEQPPDPLTDQFALGRLLYALLIKRLLEQGLARPLPLQQAAPDTPRELVQALARAAGRRRERRFPSASALREALWDPVRGTLQPIENWYAQARSTLPDVARAAVLTQAEVPSMEELGFARDPRYGRPPEPAPAGPWERQRSQARLAVHPHEFHLSDLPSTGPKRLVLTIRNTGQEELAFQLVRHVEWLRASARQVTLAPGREARAIVTVDPARLPGGRIYEPRALAVDSNVGRQWIAIRAQVATGPNLVVEETVLDFGRLEDDAERVMPLVIRNTGRQLLTGQVVARVPWLRATSAEIRVGSGAQQDLEVRLAPERLPDGPQDSEDALLLETNGGQARIVARAWRLRPRLEVGANRLDLGRVAAGELVERALVVANRGDGTLQGAARSLVPWVQVYPERWSCGPDEAVTLRVIADCAGLADGPLHVPQALRLQSNGGNASLALDVQISAPRMVLETPMLDLGRVMHGETARADLVVRNAGSAELEASLQPAVGWLRVAEERIVCPPGETRRIAVVADTSAFERGAKLEVPAALRVAAGADVATVGARLTVVRPAIRVEPEGGIDFGYVDPAEPAQRTLTLHNDGVGALAWHAQTDAEWLEIAPASGVCPEGGQADIVLTAYALALEAGKREARATLAINSDGGRVKLPLSLALASPRLEADRTFVDLGVSVNRRNVEASVRLFNRGLGRLRGNVESDTLWLVVDRASFECDMGHSVELVIRTDMDEFPEAVSEDRGVIRIRSNGGLLEIDTRLQVELVPELAPPEPVQMELGGEGRPPQGRLVLRNTGLATARVRLQPESPELELSREQLEIKPGKSVRVAVRWQGSLPASVSETAVLVYLGDDTLRVPVYVGSNRP